MTDKERDKIRERIKVKLARLEEDIGHLKLATQPIAPENSIGRISRMDAINNKSVNEAALRNAIDRQRTLKQSLVEIDGPTYGLCRNCGKDIEVGRLMIMPDGRICMMCLKGN